MEEKNLNTAAHVKKKNLQTKTLLQISIIL